MLLIRKKTRTLNNPDAILISMISPELIKTHSWEAVRITAFRLCLLVILLYTPVLLEGQTPGEEWFKQGLDAFQWQKTADAAVFFEKSVDANPLSDEYLLYLGICYHNMGQLDNAESAYTRGISVHGPRYERLLLNRGNLRMSMGRTASAVEDFEMLVNNNGRLAASAMLNRANLNVNSGEYPNALADYSSYLEMEPETPQREVIEKMIGLLGVSIKAEQERLRQEEEARLAAEAAEAARMEELLKSLSESGSDTTNIEAGTEDVYEDFEESALED